jgi:hypothetical protein
VQINRHFDENCFLMGLNGYYEIRPGKRVPASRADYEEGARRFTARLRGLVDEWLDHAQSEDGYQPQNRLPGPLGIQALVDFENSNPVKVYRGPNGERELILPVERRTIGTNGLEDPIGDSEREALRLFAEFMDEIDLKNHLAKCGRCGTYYRNQRKLAETYKTGTFCGRCRSRETAASSQSERRKKEKERVWELAVEAWKVWESRPRRIHRSVWIADQVNGGLGPRDKRIRRNWVTKHQNEIALRARELEK